MSYGASSFGASSYGSSGDKLKRLSVIYNLDAAILKSKTSAFILDSFIVWCTQPGGSGTTTIRYNVPYTINACLLKTKNNIFTLDAKLIRFIKFSLDNVLKKTINTTFNIDAFVVWATAPVPPTHTQNSIIFLLDAQIIKTVTSIFTLDAKLIRFINFEINSYLQKINTSQHTIDALIVYNVKRCPGAVVTSDDITTGTIYITDGIKNW